MLSNRLLLISYYFPPIGGVGVARALSLAKYLPDQGFDVQVLTAGNAYAVGKDEGLLRQVPPSVRIHRVATFDLPFGLRKRLKNSFSSTGKELAKPNNGFIATMRRGLVQFAKDRMSPDPQVVWVGRAAAYAKRLIETDQIGTVLITTPPYSCLMIGEALKQSFPQLKLVMEFRDEWLTYYFDTLGFNRSDYARQKAIEIERRAVEASDLIVAVTNNAKYEIEKRYPNQPANKFAVVTNGFDSSSVPVCRNQVAANERTVITYLGTMYKPTDPTPVVAAIKRLPEAIRSRLKLRVIGHVEEPSFREALESLGATVELLPFMPQQQAFESARSTDYLMVIFHDTINVPGKLYDYLGMRKPVLAVTDPTSEVWSLMRRTNAGWCADWNDVDAITAMIASAHERKPRLREEYQPNDAVIETYDRPNLAASYASLMKGLREEKTLAATAP